MTWAVRLAVAAAVLASCALATPYVRGDGNGYYAWVASVVVDRDLELTNQYRHGDPLFRARYFDEAGAVRPERLTATGRMEDQWAVGPAVLWSPFVVAADVVSRVTGAERADGFGAVYRRVVAAGTMLYALAGLWLSVQAAVRMGVSRAGAWIAAAALWLGSSLVVYTYGLPFHVHALAAFTVAWFLWYGVTRGPRLTTWQWAVWGALGGLMTITYHLDALFGLVTLGPAIAGWRAGERGRLAVGLAAGAVAAVVAAAPHLLAKAVVYGSPLTTGYQDQFFWLEPRLVAVAFSSQHGLITWTPIVALAVAGMFRLAPRQPPMRWMLVACAVFYVVVACYQNWHGLSSFGNRFFLSCLLPWVAGLGAVVDAARVRGRGAAWACAGVLVVLVAWNLGLAVQWATKMIPSRGPVDLRVVAAQQWDVPARVWSLAGRYAGRRDALLNDIEARDEREAARYRNNR